MPTFEGADTAGVSQRQKRNTRSIMAHEDACNILDIAFETDLDDARQAYRNLLRDYHPDKNPDADDRQIDELVLQSAPLLNMLRGKQRGQGLMRRRCPFTESEVQYCVFQKERLTHLQAMATLLSLPIDRIQIL